MIKVLHIYKRALPESIGGIEKFIDTLCNSISSYGIKNNVLTLSKNPKRKPIIMNGYSVHQAKENIYLGSTGFSLEAFLKFRKLLQNSDIIHHHYPHPFGDLLQLTSFTDKPYLITYHSDILRQKNLETIYKPIRYFFLKNSKKIVATSPNYFKTSNLLNKYHNKVDIIPIGISKKDFKKTSQKNINYWKKKFKSRFFLFIGVNRYYKGLKIALQAIQNTEIELVIAGSMNNKDDLINYANSRNITNVKFLGELSLEDKCSLLKLCYGFVFPSNLRSEAFGISLLEAAYFGKPLISCEIGTGTTFVNIHNETGIVINPSDPIDLKEAMLKLLKNEDLAKKFGFKAKLRAKKLFNSDKTALSYLNLYEKIIRDL